MARHKNKKRDRSRGGGGITGRRGFTDASGRHWVLDVTVATVRRVKRLLDVQLLDAVDPEAELCSRLGVDACLLADVLYVVCLPQADERGVSDEEFGRALAGDAIEEASEGLLRAVCDFFPNRVQRAVRHRMLDRAKSLQTHLQTQVQNQMARAWPEPPSGETSSNASAGASPA